MKSIVKIVIYAAVLAISVYFGIFQNPESAGNGDKKSDISLFSAEARDGQSGDGNAQSTSKTLHLKFRSWSRAKELFENHKDEFGGRFGSADAYVKSANETVMNADAASVNDTRGDMVFLDKDTCYIAVVSNQYEFRTFIKPRDCIGYFENQNGKAADPQELINSFPKWAFSEKYAGGGSARGDAGGSRAGSSNTSKETAAIPDYEFTSEASAKSHFAKHGGEFGGAYRNWQEYVRGANSAIARHTREKTRSGGDKLYLVDESCEFVVLASFGKIGTYFRPNDCARYFERQ